MPRSIFREAVASLFFFGALVSCSHHKSVENLCPHVTLRSHEDLHLSDTEKRFICGDKDEPAYNNIPSYQAKFSIEGFLQQRGYSLPKFEYVGDKLIVDTGEKSYLSAVLVNSKNIDDSKELEKELLRHNKKEVLTPKLLDEMEAEATKFLRNRGYPCVKVTSSVDPENGKMVLEATNLEPFIYGEIPREKIEGIDDRALARFFPFTAQDSFSELGLTLAEKRFLRSGIVLGTYFQEKCELKKHEFSLSQQFIVGAPHTIRFGIGASTEVGPMIRARWTNQRYGPMASQLEAYFQSSLKTQTLKLSSDEYMWPDHPRRSLYSELQLERNDQTDFTEFTAGLKPHMQWTSDSVNRFWQWTAGPSLLAGTFKTVNSSDNRSYKTAAIEASLQSKTHDFEVFDIHPEEGNFAQVNLDFRHPALGFSDPLLKLDLTYLKLYWLGNLGRGKAIGGIHFNAGTAWIRDGVNLSTLPPSVKFYGGGSEDIRGFKLATLPDNAGVGAVSKVSAKLEFRKTYFFIPAIEAFSFLDGAYFGEKSWEVSSRLWYSPGVGLRWLSPIGLVQTYLARSLTTQESKSLKKDNGSLFYLGLGGVF
jgi:translocation and assembly module TamA